MSKRNYVLEHTYTCVVDGQRKKFSTGAVVGSDVLGEDVLEAHPYMVQRDDKGSPIDPDKAAPKSVNVGGDKGSKK